MNSTDFRNYLKQLKSPFFEIIVLSVCVSLALIVKLNEPFFGPSDSNKTAINIIIFLNIIISASAFIFSIYIYQIIKNRRMLMSSFVLLTVTVLDLPLIFDFSVRGVMNPDNVIFLLFIGRLLGAVGFILVLLFSDDRRGELSNLKISFLSLTIIIGAGSLFTCVLYGPFTVSSKMLAEFQGLTPPAGIMAAAVIFISIVTLFVVFKKYYKVNEPLYRRLFLTFAMILFSIVSMSNIKFVNDIWNLFAYVFQINSCIILLNFYYLFGIKRPHSMLIRTKEELDNYVSELDRLVEKRTAELRAINEKLLADQEVARRMQLSMLPEILPGNDYVAFSASYVPADNLSGDFYNVFRLDESRFAICIGDVSGHGVSAAMLSIYIIQRLQALLEEEGREGMSIPSVVLGNIYESMNASNFDENMYIVMIYGIFNTDTGIFSYASGGLNTTPLRVRPDGSIQELDNTGFAICKLRNFYKPQFVNHQVLLFPNDKLILYTDGLVDAKNKEKEKYSLSRLKNVIKDQYKWGVDHLSQSITRDVKEFIGTDPSDDITLLILDVLPPF